MNSTMSEAVAAASDLLDNYESTHRIPFKREQRKEKSDVSVDSNGDPKPKRRLESR